VLRHGTSGQDLVGTTAGGRGANEDGTHRRLLPERAERDGARSRRIAAHFVDSCNVLGAQTLTDRSRNAIGGQGQP